MDLEARYRAATLEQIEIERRIEAIHNAPAAFYVPLDYVFVCAVVACILPLLDVWWQTRSRQRLSLLPRRSLAKAIAPLPPTAAASDLNFEARLLQRCLAADPALTHFMQHALRQVMHDPNQIRTVLGEPALQSLGREEWKRVLDANYFTILESVVTSTSAFGGSCPLRTRKWLARGLSVFAMDLRILFEGQLPLLQFYRWRSTRATKCRGSLPFVALLALQHFESSEASVERRVQLHTCIKCFMEGLIPYDLEPRVLHSHLLRLVVPTATDKTSLLTLRLGALLRTNCSEVETALASWSHEDRAYLEREWRTCHDHPILFQGTRTILQTGGLPTVLRCLINAVRVARSMPQPERRHQRLIIRFHLLAPETSFAVSRVFHFRATSHLDLIFNAQDNAIMTPRHVGNKN
ncbi:hypothetical protein SDRG_10054 [Saprolegnia diclina VS20]|uniref:Uncharacterized protein n=1 Tax=Saprolegnia diclina (strain VS20) TaxID=1156394 RepID=T0RQG2_SAPDV|nr:hypothetical protein SDRG_10054 [Saprolegnia diclina VS20]EQC32307.1 hypothetical protein SDRG_10054 [Saprolegnia diclina VS20]|eukprot:XP_008614248.1 hypothetical protein SDRG_10054 [Saprolegnia diclina VS20]